MSNQFTIEHNSTAVSEVLRQLSEQLSDLTDPMQQIAAVMADATEEALELEADPATGEPWQELSDNYLTANPKRVGGKMLQLSAGGLVSSITTDHGPSLLKLVATRFMQPFTSSAVKMTWPQVQRHPCLALFGFNRRSRNRNFEHFATCPCTAQFCLEHFSIELEPDQKHIQTNTNLCPHLQKWPSSVVLIQAKNIQNALGQRGSLRSPPPQF